MNIARAFASLIFLSSVGMSVEDKIYILLEKAILDLGYNLVRVKYFDNSKILQIMIEKADGTSVSLDDCEIVSNTVSVILDVEDPITSNYNLEVSSVGLDRPLMKKEDYERFTGREIKIQLSRMVDDVRKFKGVIEEVVANSVIMRLDTNQRIKIDFDNIVSAHLTIDTKELFNKKRSYG
jgi:ribosome maturation factor RimP